MTANNIDVHEPLNEVHITKNTITDKSLDSTRRMVALCEESQEAGLKTLVMLDDQGEQLERIEEGLDAINKDMKEAEENLAGMDKCCGLCVLPCGKAKFAEKISKYENAWKKDDDGAVVSDQPRVVSGGPESRQEHDFINRITNDAREDEMNENLLVISTMVGNLRHMAVDVGTEISNQNQQIDLIGQKASCDQERVNAANYVAAKLIHK
uniref:Synaptosomal-associated protein n=1 Tax=Plectus sambesii TaxID=2011161 RepID=A0A914W8L0_9BILA